MPFDIDLACYNAVAGMSSYAATTALVKPNCFIFSTQQEATAKRQHLRIPNDYPQIRLDMRQPFVWPQNTPRTFGMLVTNFASSIVDFGVPGTLQLALTLIHETPNLTNQTLLEAAVRKYLASKFPTLGVTDGAGKVCVTGFGVVGRRADEMSETTGGVLRTVTRLVLTINARVKFSQLTA